jgi:hypothetical protein
MYWRPLAVVMTVPSPPEKSTSRTTAAVTMAAMPPRKNDRRDQAAVRGAAGRFLNAVGAVVCGTAIWVVEHVERFVDAAHSLRIGRRRAFVGLEFAGQAVVGGGHDFSIGAGHDAEDRIVVSRKRCGFLALLRFFSA